MIYHLDLASDRKAAWTYFTKLNTELKTVELKHVKPQRSNQQNKYLHLILGMFAKETGYTAPEAKQVLKKVICPDIFIYAKNLSGDKIITFEKSTSELDSKTLTDVIDRFREFANTELNIQLPLPNDYYYLDILQNELEK